MGAYAAKKVSSSSTDGFNETVAWKLLMCSNVDGNNNKFYCIELQTDGAGRFRLFSHYGRLRGSVVDGGVYDVRGPDTDEATMRREFAAIIVDKGRGKTKSRPDGTKYVEKYEEVDVLSPTVGSANIRKASGVAGSATVRRDADLSQVFASYDIPVRTLLKQLLEENVHRITSMTTLTMTANGLETPLGPVTPEHIARARSVLDALRACMPTGDGQSASAADGGVRGLNTQYFSLVPRPFGARIDDSDMILRNDSLLGEYDLLDQMAAAVQVVQDDSKTATPDLGLEMALASADVTEAIRRHVDRTRNHHALDVWKVKRVYEIRNTKERDRFQKRATSLQQRRPGSPEYDLFHGSRNANVLSILLNGFCVPPVSAPHVTGRMFGNGVYGADVSTKALNYSTGYWNNAVGNKYPSTFLFLSRFAMGRVYETSHSLKSGVPGGYDSIFAKGGADLLNNEYIVPDPAQATITHLIEFGKA